MRNTLKIALFGFAALTSLGSAGCLVRGYGYGGYGYATYAQPGTVYYQGGYYGGVYYRPGYYHAQAPFVRTYYAPRPAVVYAQPAYAAPATSVYVQPAAPAATVYVRPPSVSGTIIVR